MRPGSVIVDLAAEQGGNCALTEPGREVVRHGVLDQRPAQPAQHAAVPRQPDVRPHGHELTSTHLLKDGRVHLDLSDELTRGPLVTHQGEIVHEAVEDCVTDAVPRSNRRRPMSCTSELEIGLYIFMLAGFLGYHVISRVPPLLHTPLMSATNAMSGISLVGSLVVAGSSSDGTLEHHSRLHRGRLFLDQRRRRLPHHRPHAADVQEGRESRPASGRPRRGSRPLVLLVAGRAVRRLLWPLLRRPSDARLRWPAP